MEILHLQGLTRPMDNELANDRTYLAWLRTGIALFGLGFVVAKVALIVRPTAATVTTEDLYSGAGVVIVMSGAALIVVGFLQHRAVLRGLRPEGSARRVRWPLAITAVAVVGSLLLSALIVVST